MRDYKPYNSLPLNADDVNFRMQHLRVFDLVDMVAHRKLSALDEDETLRKYLDIWTIHQKSLFIESLMLKFPVPLFYFDGSEQPWTIIDGIQRIFAILDFLNKKFKLTGLEYLENEAETETFDTLPGYLQARIMDAELIAYVINPGTSRYSRYNIFRRLNTTGNGSGFGLNRNEIKIRNIFFNKDVIPFISDLARNKLFLELTKPARSNSKGEDEMMKREYLSYFTAFYLFGYKDYSGDMDAFLSNAFMELSFKYPSFSHIYDNFEKGMYRMHQLIVWDNRLIVRRKNNLLPFTALISALCSLDDSDFKYMMMNNKIRTSFTNDFHKILSEYYARLRPSNRKAVTCFFHDIETLLDKYTL